LSTLDAQVFSLSPPPAVHLVVADNSPTGDARQVVQGEPGRWPRHYVHEPRAGISHARNACLDALPEGTDLIAMIDDDEVPCAQWLDHLLDARRRSGADVVAGPAVPQFPPGTPPWVAASGFFLKPRNQHELSDLHPDPPVATCNVLLGGALLKDPVLRFDAALARSGGEDKLLFQAAKLKGYAFAWSPQAVTLEAYPAERATLAYMLRESYRRGCVKYRVKRLLKARSAAKSLRIAARLLGRSLWRLAVDGLRLLLNLPRGRAHWVGAALDMADSAGTAAGVLGIPNRHYRPGR